MVDNRDRVKIILRGEIFITSRKLIQAHPSTTLGKLLNDGDQTTNNDGPQEFYFDRNPILFHSILDFYTAGSLHFPSFICAAKIKNEIEFWDIHEKNIPGCCWKKLAIQETDEIIFRNIDNTFDWLERWYGMTGVKKYKQHIGCFSKLKQNIWLFFEDPKSSKAAKIWSVLFLLMSICSITVICLESVPACRIPATNPIPLDANVTNPKQIMYATTDVYPSIEYFDLVLNCIFTVELMLRIVVSPNKKLFMKSVLTWNDFICVIPMWIAYVFLYVMPTFKTNETLVWVFTAIALTRVFRVFRILKLARHYVGLQVLYLAIKASFKELILLVVFLCIGMVVFSVLIYYAEYEQSDHFQTIPMGIWWSIVTMTTVGYGDEHPTQPIGYVIGGACAMCGIIATALPIPIIARNFNQYYLCAQMRLRQRKVTLNSSVSSLTATQTHAQMSGYDNKIFQKEELGTKDVLN
ncbi:unnamed protein product [Owenia fusiformis]|uniref:Uncharacterized protein n=1 Tax=Owenia fusiformis TaxID=6347 RepID=A0A8J1TLN4_OWEFU|nr:unnamed protein product [Owenia fusiformis]